MIKTSYDLLIGPVVEINGLFDAAREQDTRSTALQIIVVSEQDREINGSHQSDGNKTQRALALQNDRQLERQDKEMNGRIKQRR